MLAAAEKLRLCEIWPGVLTHKLELFWVEAHLFAPSICHLGKGSGGLHDERDGIV